MLTSAAMMLVTEVAFAAAKSDSLRGANVRSRTPRDQTQFVQALHQPIREAMTPRCCCYLQLLVAATPFRRASATCISRSNERDGSLPSALKF